MAVTIKGKTKTFDVNRNCACKSQSRNSSHIPTAFNDRSQRLPGMATMVMAAFGTSSTVVLTASPIAMARAAAMTI
jgi:hypothetical protein